MIFYALAFFVALAIVYAGFLLLAPVHAIAALHRSGAADWFSFGLLTVFFVVLVSL